MSKRSGTGIQLTAKEADALLALIAIAEAGAAGEGDYAGFDYRAMDRAHQKLVNARGGVESPATGTRTALTLVEGFIRDELENRKESFLPEPTDEESGYIQSAESALDAVKALDEMGRMDSALRLRKEGEDAALAGRSRVAPQSFCELDKLQWLRGYDAAKTK